MSADSPKLYLLDVEGTVAPLTLTTEVLFPYARKHFSAFLKEHFGETALRLDLHALATERKLETDQDAPRCFGDGQESLAYLFWLMDRDRKSTALKSLQGKIWKEGFESGELKGTVFDDVPPALARWAAQAKIAIYSSGSVEAQKLFFHHSSAGDLTGLIGDYFDTRTGVKTEPASYSAIAEAMNAEPGECLFFSDALKELDAAREAGLGTRLVVRPGNPPVEDLCGHQSIDSFESL
jgi:enolase-phosphatase E1